MIITALYGMLALASESIVWEWKASFFTMLVDWLWVFAVYASH